MDEKLLFAGCLDNLPDEESSVIRVFLSSTFTDMSAERNEIMKIAVPELRSFCREKGLEFEICDMRWGVRDDACISHSTTDICLKELKTCQQMSRGPNFVAILGNKYGYCPYPSRLNEKEFVTLRDIVAEQAQEDRELMNAWFKKDTNCTPPMYILQPITDILQHYDDTNADSKELFEQDQTEWRRIDKELSRIIHYAADSAYDKGMITAEDRHRFQRSITEHEITEGVLTAAEKNNKVLCFTRDITSLDLSSELSARYIDMTTNGEVKKKSLQFLKELKCEKLAACLDEDQLRTYEVEWTPEGIVPDNPEHKIYLQNVREVFIGKMKEMITSSLAQRRPKRYHVYQEVLHQLHFCKRKCEDFQGRGQLIKELQTALENVYETVNEDKNEGKHQNMANKENRTESEVEFDSESMSAGDNSDDEDDEELEYSEQKNQEMVREQYAGMKVGLQQMGISYCMEEYSDLSDPNKDVKMESLKVMKGTKHTKPLVVFGESGCGKTAFMAKLAEVINREVPSSAWIVRSLGTSPQSSSIRDTLVTVCHQIFEIFDLEPPRFDLQDDYPFLIQYFAALLWKVNSASKPLYILFDSLDQLNSIDHAFSLNWLPIKLPPHVHVVVSTLPQMHGLLTTLKNRLINDELFYEVMPLPMADASNLLLKVWSRSARRQFTQQQRQILKDKVSFGAAPLYLKLLFYQAVKWHSYTDISNIELGMTAEAAINKLFDDLEVLHGKTLISKAFGYISAAKNGLSNQEMEHLLSLDDEVLQDVYLHHLPPNDNVITLPSLIWRRVVYDLGEYLVDRRADGRTIKTWYHRQFRQVAEERYLQGDTKVRLHSAMVEYFTGIWSNKPKALELYKMKIGRYPHAYRQVPDQPLLLGKSMFNLRKLTELPHHLIHGRKFSDFRDLVSCNLVWLYTKCKAVGLSETLDDLEVAVSVWRELKCDVTDLDEIIMDIKLVTDLLILGNDSIRKNPINLPVQVLGQLGTNCQKSVAIEGLVSQAAEWCGGQPYPLMVPQHPCMPSPGGVLKLTINAYLQTPGAFRNASVIRSCLALHKDTHSLLVVEMGGKLQNTDSLRTYDLEDGQCVSTCELDNRICNIDLIGSERFIQLEWTTNRDDYDPSCFQRVLSTSSLSTCPLPRHVTALCMSQSAALFAFAVGKDVFVRPSDSILQVKNTVQEDLFSHKGNVIHIIISPDDRYMVTTTSAEKQLVWDLNSKSCLRELDGGEKKSWTPGKVIGAFVYITHKNWLICTGMGYRLKNKVFVTDIITGDKVYEFESASSHYGNEYIRLNSRETVALLATRSTGVVNGITDKWATLWSLETGKLLSNCSTVNGPYSEVNMFGDADHIFIAACQQRDPVINIMWAGSESEPLEEAVLVRVLIGHNDEVIQVVLSQDELISASSDNTVKVWDLKEIRADIEHRIRTAESPDSIKFCPSVEQGRLPIPGRDQIKSTAMVVCGNRAVVGSKDGFLIFYDLETSQLLSYIRPCTTGIFSILVTQDKQHIVAASPSALFILKADGDMAVREIPTPKKIRVNCVCETANIVVAGHGGMEACAFAWNLVTGESVGKYQGLYGFNCVALNSTATRLAGSFFEFPALYVVETAELLTGLDKADVMMSSQSFLTFSPDDRYLAGGCTDGSVRVMDGHTGKYLLRFQQLSSAIAGSFSPDSKTLVTSGFRTLFLWSVANGTLLRSLSRHQDFVVTVKFCLGGKYMVSSSKDKRIIVWDWRHLYGYSVSDYMAHCPIDVMDVADDLTSIIYAPDSVHYVSILKPNNYLRQKLSGQLGTTLPTDLQQAQAMALSFSSQALTRETTRACILL